MRAVFAVFAQDFGVGGDPSSAFFKTTSGETNGSAVISYSTLMPRSCVVLKASCSAKPIGGAFSVHTRKAEIGSNDAPLILTSGNASTRYRRCVNIPINDSFAMRLAGYSSHEEGFVKNVFSGRDEIDHSKKAIRWSTRYESDALSIDTVVDWEDRKQSGSMYRAIDKGDIYALDTHC